LTQYLGQWSVNSSPPSQGFAPKKLLYSDYARLPESKEAELKAEYTTLEELVK